MDQIYIPKNRIGFEVGSYVMLKTVSKKQHFKKPYLYNINFLEPAKIWIINKIFETIDKIIPEYENIIITGSFLDIGFNFNDIDVVIVTKAKSIGSHIENKIKNIIKIKTHVIVLDDKLIANGISTDPLYSMMFSKCAAKKRFVYKAVRKINYKILDLHLIKSKSLIANFDNLNGNEKYYLVRNMIAIYLFMQNRKISQENVDHEIEKIFELKIDKIKQNMLSKKIFLNKYKSTYNLIFHEILEKINDE